LLLMLWNFNSENVYVWKAQVLNFMQIGCKMTDLEAFEVLSVFLEHPVYYNLTWFSK